MKRGYFGIGVFRPKTEENIGTLWRHANNFGADFIFTIGRRYRHQATDTSMTHRHIPLYHYEDFEDFDEHSPVGCPLIAVELASRSIPLPGFVHPERAIYLLGAEDRGLPDPILRTVDYIVEIPTGKPQSMNVAVSGTVVMYDRFVKSST